MKLIIDIPKRVYDATKTMENVIDADNEIVAEAIANGIPIDDIVDKLEDRANSYDAHGHKDIALGLTIAREVLHKYWWNSLYQNDAN